MRSVWADRIAGIVVTSYIGGTANAVALEHHSALFAGLVIVPLFLASARLIR